MRLLLPPLHENDLVLVDLVARPEVATVILTPPVLDIANLRKDMEDKPYPGILSERRVGPEEAAFRLLAASDA